MLISLPQMKMMAICRTAFFKWLWLGLAIMLFNCSVDCSTISEYNAHNQQESFVEIVLENFMNMGNVIAEDTNDGDLQQDLTTKKSNSVDVFIIPFLQIEKQNSLANKAKEYTSKTQKRYINPALDPQSPPPKS